MGDKKRSFEENMLRLEEIVDRLEKGEVCLDESLALFAEGTHLVSVCRGALEQAEQQVVKLMKGPDGEPVESEFTTEE